MVHATKVRKGSANTTAPEPVAIAHTTTSTPEPAVTTPNLAENGAIYGECLSKIKVTSNNLKELAGAIEKAINSRCWLGFLHPQTGQYCSFIHHDKDGGIDDSISFKLWLASDPKQGGLGITDPGLLQGLLKSNTKLMGKVLPLLADGESIRQANRILEEKGQPPLIRFGKAKEYSLKKINATTEPLKNILIAYDIPYTLALRFTQQYDRLYGEAESVEVERVNKELEQLDKLDQDRAYVFNRLYEILGLERLKHFKMSVNDPKSIAERLKKEIPADTLKMVLDTLQTMLNE